MAFVIVAGEMIDVDYCKVYGPYDTMALAEAEAQAKIDLGIIELEAEDCLDYRIFELKD